MQRNTIIHWLFILTALYLTFILTSNLNSYILKIIIFIGIYGLLLLVLDYLYYFKKIRIKSEKEALANSYDWFDFTMHPDNFDTNRGDLTEGLYDGNYELNAESAMKKKYDTYYDFLKLQSGMTLLDLGCGYCHWAKYLKKRGINVIGVTLSLPQKEKCENYKIKVYLEDFRKFIAQTNKTFDAVCALGSLEHLTSGGMTIKEEERVHNEFFRNINRILKPGAMALITVCNMNPNYSGWKIYSNEANKSNKYNLKDYVHMYNIATFYGCGRYPHLYDYRKYLNNFFMIDKAQNITEDYRWAGIRFGDNHWQNSKIFINTPYRFAKFAQYILTDPWIIGRLNYSFMKSWYWQFGGDSKFPKKNNDNSPVIVNCYVLKNKKYNKKWKNDPDALNLIN